MRRTSRLSITIHRGQYARSHWRSLILATLLIFLGIAYSIVSAQRRHVGPNDSKADSWHWQVFRGPDGDFTLAFPGKPKAQSASPGPVTEIRSFDLTTAEGMNFSINFHDIGGDPRSSQNNEWGADLEKALSDADRSQGFHVVQVHRLAKNLVQSEIWQDVPESNSRINYLRRSIIRRGRIYTLACGWVVNEKTVNKATCSRFFGSMHFITKPNHRP